MGIMTTISGLNAFADIYTGKRSDGTVMFIAFDELLDHVEHDVLCLLLCGDTIIANLPISIGMTDADFAAMEQSIADEINVAANEQLTQDYILGYK